MNPVIQTSALLKNYGRVFALRGIDLEVRQGEIFGFLGPNGSGKTTTVKILLNFVRPGGGLVRLLGESPDRVDRRNIGYLPERINVHPFLSIREFLIYQARMIRLRGAEQKKRVDECLERTGLADVSDRKIGACSKGMLQRAGIGQALLGKPDLLILDEPNSGLDPIGIQDMRRIIQEENKRGATVFLNSHQLLEVEKTCDRVAILHQGRIVAQGTKEELSGKKGVTVEMEAMSEKIEKLIRKADPAARIAGTRAELSIEDEEEERLFPGKLVEAKGRILSYTQKRESLEEIFSRAIRGNEGGDGSAV